MEATHTYTDKYTKKTKQVLIKAKYKNGRNLLIEEADTGKTLPWSKIVGYWTVKEIV
jgi:hypothetical protein